MLAIPTSATIPRAKQRVPRALLEVLKKVRPKKSALMIIYCSATFIQTSCPALTAPAFAADAWIAGVKENPLWERLLLSHDMGRINPIQADGGSQRPYTVFAI